MPNTACPGPAHAAYSAFRLSDSSPSRGLPLLLPFVRHRLSDSSPFRGLPLSALVRHQRSVSSATRPFLPFVRHQRSFSSASRGWLAPLLPIHGTAAARGSGGATALPHLVPAPGTECALQLARCASGYDGDLYRALPFVGHWCPDFAPPVCMPARRGASCPRRPSAVAAAHRGIPGVTVLYGV